VRVVPRDGDRGQATIEWVGLVLLISLILVGALAAAGGGVPGTGLARAIAVRLLCAVDLSRSCAPHGDLVAAYGPELAARVAANAPEIVYEAGMTALPVDFGSCRGSACANGPDSGSVWTSDTGTAVRMSARLDFGCVWVNCHIPLQAEMPHGGFKHSGYGKDLSVYGLEDYTRIKHVMQYHGFEG